jgi:hypothetical protein
MYVHLHGLHAYDAGARREDNQHDRHVLLPYDHSLDHVGEGGFRVLCIRSSIVSSFQYYISSIVEM